MDAPAIGVSAPSRVLFWVALSTWGAAVVGYWAWLAVYSYSPGRLLAPPTLRQVRMPFAPEGGRHLLVMALHPRCPCSRSSIGELSRLTSKFHDDLKCVVLVYKPGDATDNWLETDLVAVVRQLPDTDVVVDDDGRQALRLGMKTSGSVILYSPQGIPQFWGGITAGRGHFGDNLGSDAISAVMHGQQPTQRSQPVYGCQIQSDDDAGDTP